MGTTNYKNFDLNDTTTAKPWAPRELQAWKDAIDTMVMDCITPLKQVVGGHKHARLYNPSLTVGIEVLAGGVVQMANLSAAGIVVNDVDGKLSTVVSLPVAKGGTNSVTALVNGLVMISSGDAIVEGVITTTELAILDDMTGIATGAADNDKFATQGYVDDNIVPPIVPIDRGGTNSGAALNNNRVMISSSGAIVESPSVTTAELALLNGMASVSAGSANNDKLVTQGYVDDSTGGLNSFIGLSDTPGSFTINRIPFESGTAITDSDLFTWDNANETLQLLNDDASNVGAKLRFRKSRSGGSTSGNDVVGEIIFEGYNGEGWDQWSKIKCLDIPEGSPAVQYYVGSLNFMEAVRSAVVFNTDQENRSFVVGTLLNWAGFFISSGGQVGINSSTPLQLVGGATSFHPDYIGLHVKNPNSPNGLEVGAVIIEGNSGASLIMCANGAASNDKTLEIYNSASGYTTFRSLTDAATPTVRIADILNMDLGTGECTFGHDMHLFNAENDSSGRDIIISKSRGIGTDINEGDFIGTLTFEGRVGGAWVPYLEIEARDQPGSSPIVWIRVADVEIANIKSDGWKFKKDLSFSDNADIKLASLSSLYSTNGKTGETERNAGDTYARFDKDTGELYGVPAT